LSDFCSADDVAGKLGTHPAITRKFMDALATVDLVEKKDGLYRNLPDTQAFLTEGGPQYVGAMLQMVQRMSVDPLDNLLHLLKEGPVRSTGWESLVGGFDWVEMARHSAAWVFGEVGEMIARTLSKLEGFEAFEKMLDMGGGHGVFALYIVGAHPSMKGVVFDRPEVTEVAKTFIDRYEMAERVSVAAGDYMTDDLGAGYDLIWASATLNLAGPGLDTLFGKIHSALKPGGYFAAFQDGLTHEHTKPEIMLGHLAGVLSAGEDLSFEQGFIAETMLKCGFQSVRSRTVETPMGAMDLDIARKAAMPSFPS
jgi:SAM-dependent methyltransferase